MRILHVIPSLTLAAGGPPVVAVNIARALQAADVAVSICTTTAFNSNPKNTEVDDPPPGLSELDARVFPTGRLERLAFSRELGIFLEKSASEFDVIHIHMLFQFPQMAAFKAAKRHDVPYVVSPHGALDPYLRGRGRLRKWVVDQVFQRRMLDEASAIHYTTDEERDLAEDLAFRARGCVIPNGVDVQAFSQRPCDNHIEDIRSTLHLGDGPLVLNHGRLDRKKGLPILIKALALVRSRLPDAQLVLIGPDSRGHRAELEKLASEAGVSDGVVFAGLWSGTELLSLIHSADVWALPSHSENFGYAVVEAMAAGTPVLTSPYVNVAPNASSFGALRMISNQPSSFAEAIIHLLENPRDRTEMGERGQAYAKRFDWPKVGQGYLDLYSRVVEERRGTRGA